MQKLLVANGVIAVAEGANMPTTIEATKILQDAGVLFAPAKLPMRAAWPLPRWR